MVRYVKKSKSIEVIKDIKTSDGKMTVFNPYGEIYWEKENYFSFVRKNEHK
jgi:hypothetical protein